MKQEITASEIQVGDLIRTEAPEGVMRDGVVATEWRVRSDDLNGTYSDRARFYLLDRPEPAVVLPAPGEHVMGWITSDDHPNHPYFGDYSWRNVHVEDGPVGQIMRSNIVAFVPAIAVPVKAFDVLREAVNKASMSPARDQQLADFFAAVRKANS